MTRRSHLPFPLRVLVAIGESAEPARGRSAERIGIVRASLADALPS